MSELLQDVDNILDSLNGLAPNLQDPAPQDIYERDLSPSKGKPTRDIELAARMFPASSAPWLVYRIGNANWRRRRYLESLRGNNFKFPSRIHQRSKRYNASTTDVQPQRSLSMSPPPLSKPEHFELARDTSAVSLSHITVPSSAASKNGKSSAEQTIFSRSASTQGFTVSTRTEAMSEVDPESKIELFTTSLIVPPPPIPLQDGNRFPCPYCRLEITVGDAMRTDQDWRRHVFADLEPYLCTFKDCLRASKTFGMKYDWIRHELDSHRIQKFWRCPSCQHEFLDRADFQIHLTEKHEDIVSENQFEILSTLSERSSEQTSAIGDCLLCRVEFDDRKALEDHVATHLEQFALTSINFVNTADDFDDDSCSETFDDNASETRVKLETLNTFVEEQLKNLFPSLQNPPDDDMERSNLDFVEDSDNEKQHDEGDQSQDYKHENAWESKVASFLRKQPAAQIAQEGLGSITQSRPSSARVAVPKNSTVKSNVSVVRTNQPPRNDEFEGRVHVLNRIKNEFAAPGSICILSGAGGIGKTATAVEYTYQDEFPFIFWVQAETLFGCADSYCFIATQLRLGEGEMQDQDTLILITRRFLQSTKERWLLIFDNADNWSDIKPYIPTDLENTSGSVLLTTRRIDFGKEITGAYLQIELSVLTLEESKRLLLHSIQASQGNEDLTKHPEYELAGQISNLAERFPLAISHIAGYVKVSQCSLAEFLELWEERRSSAGGAINEETSQTEKTLETVWNIGLRELSSDGLSLLHILAFLDSDSIQQDLLIGKHRLSSLDFLNSAESVR